MLGYAGKYRLTDPETGEVLGGQVSAAEVRRLNRSRNDTAAKLIDLKEQVKILTAQLQLDQAALYDAIEAMREDE